MELQKFLRDALGPLKRARRREKGSVPILSPTLTRAFSLVPVLYKTLFENRVLSLDDDNLKKNKFEDHWFKVL